MCSLQPGVRQVQCAAGVRSSVKTGLQKPVRSLRLSSSPRGLRKWDGPPPMTDAEHPLVSRGRDRDAAADLGSPAVAKRQFSLYGGSKGRRRRMAIGPGPWARAFSPRKDFDRFLKSSRGGR